MNMRISWLALAALLIATAAEAGRLYEYKCWVTVAAGHDWISFHKLATAGAHSQAASLLEAQGVIIRQEQHYKIQAVHECVPVDEVFVSVAARALDAVTLR